MSPVSPLLIARFAQLPRNSAEAWQGGLVRLPTWIEKGPDGKPYRPWAAIWVSLRSGLMNLKMGPERGGHDPTLALETLLEVGLNKKLAGCRPARLEVADEELGAYLVRTLGDEHLTFTVSRDLRAIKQVLVHYGEYVNRAPLPPDALDAPGVTVERMRAFAEAAKHFCLAAPWRYLTHEDLIHIEAPSVERGLRHLTVLGAGGQVFGLGFYETPGDFETLLANPIRRPSWKATAGGRSCLGRSRTCLSVIWISGRIKASQWLEIRRILSRSGLVRKEKLSAPTPGSSPTWRGCSSRWRKHASRRSIRAAGRVRSRLKMGRRCLPFVFPRSWNRSTRDQR